MIIAVDFDGTCVVHDFPLIGEPMPGAVETLKKLIAAGHKIILWTCRENHPTDPDSKFLFDAERWFEFHEIELFGVNATPPEAEFRESEGVTIRKAFAHIYIDDRNLGGFPGWNVVEEMLLGKDEDAEA